MSGRIPEVEQAYLAAIQVGASSDLHFSQRVLHRLDRVGHETGRDLPQNHTIADVLAEVREEAEDVAGWSIMALHLARQRGVPNRAQRALGLRLRIAGVLAALIDQIVAGAELELPREAGRPSARAHGFSGTGSPSAPM